MAGSRRSRSKAPEGAERTEEMSPKKPTDSDAWDELDWDREDKWAVVCSESYSCDPWAVFKTEEMAEEWIKLQEAKPEDERWICDPIIVRLRDVKGWSWNSFDEIPDEGAGR